MNNKQLLDELAIINRSILHLFEDASITEQEAYDLHNAFASVNTVIQSVRINRKYK